MYIEIRRWNLLHHLNVDSNFGSDDLEMSATERQAEHLLLSENLVRTQESLKYRIMYMYIYTC